MRHSIKYLFLLLLCLPSRSQAQDVVSREGLDSMVRQLSTMHEDSAKVFLLNDLAYEFNLADPDKSIQLSEQGLALAQKLHFQNGIALSYGNLASGYQTKAAYPEALDYYLKALGILEALGNKARIGRMQGNIGTLYYSMEKYPEALAYYTQAMNSAISLHDTLGMSSSMGNVGSAYRLLGDYDKALLYLNRALKVNQSLDYKKGMLGNFANIAIVYAAKKDFSRALHYHFQSMRLSQETGNKMGLAMNLENIGTTYAQIFTDSSTRIVADSLVSTDRRENLRKGLNYLKQALIVAKETGDLNDISTVAKDLSETAALGGDFEEAYRYYQEHNKYKDSVFSMDKSLQISARETQREAELKEQQIRINKQEVLQKRSERLIFIAGSALLCMVILGVFRNYKAQKQRNSLQEELLTQKEMLMKEIHHRVKNNLQVVSTLLDLQLMNVADTNAKDAIAESASRLKAMSLIHEQLYQDDHITTIECGRFTEDLHQQVSAVFRKPGQAISFHNEGPEMVLDVDTAVPLGLIINELMTNSYKYAFKSAIGSISLKIEQAGDHYHLLYRDSGDGLPAGMNIKALKSLGMKIIHGLSKQLGGSFRYEAGVGSFIVTFKDLSGRKLID